MSAWRAALSAVVMGVASIACSGEQEQPPDLRIGPPPLVEIPLRKAVAAGDIEGALEVIAAANKQDPDHAYARSLLLRTLVGKTDALRVRAGLEALDLLRRLPNPQPRAPYARLNADLAGTAELAYVRGEQRNAAFADVFVDAVALLGAGKVQDLARGEAPSPKQRMVIASGGVDVGALPANRVVALGPQPQLVQLLGLEGETVIPMRGCVLKSADSGLTLLSASALELPIEGSVSVYRRAATTAQVVATLHCSDGEHPALYRLERPAGAPAFMFAFNLLEAVVRTRQGDPALKGKEVDAVYGARPSDLFARDLSAAQLLMPFSDLLLEATLELIEGAQPKLRFWHNPAGKRGVFIITSDQDFAEEGRMAIMMVELAQWGVPATFYLTSGTYQKDGIARLAHPAPGLVVRARELGFSFGAHPFLYEEDRPVSAMIEEHKRALQAGYNQGPHSSRFHEVRWPGYEEPAQSLATAGYRYDTSYLTLNSKHIAGLGYMTGGGLPLRFYRPDGQALGIRQLATQLDDHPSPIIDTRLRDNTGRSLQIPYPEFVASTRAIVEAAGRRFHSPLVVNNHPFQFGDDPSWLRMLVETAQIEQLAILDVERYDDFVSALIDSEIVATSDPNSFRVLVQAPKHDLVVRNYAGVAVTVDGQRVGLRKSELYGRSEKLLTLTRGTHDIVLQ